MGVDNYGPFACQKATINDLSATDVEASNGIKIKGAAVLDLVKSVSVTLTSAQIKALAASPQTIVAAVPSSVIKVVSVGLKMNYGGTNVFTEAGQKVALYYTNAAGTKATDAEAATGWIDGAADQYLMLGVGPSAGTAASVVNTDLVISQDGAEWAGNAAGDNTVTVVVDFVLESFA